MPAKLSKVERTSREYRHQLLNGYVLAIDPSSGSATGTQSYPGYAIFRAGILEEQGLIDIVGKGKAPWERLRLIQDSFLSDFEQPDVLVIETIRTIHNRMEMSLLWSVGVAVAALSPKYGMIEMPPQTWRRFIDDDYVKSDNKDAVCIGHAAIQLAQGTQDKVPKEWLQ
jgi:hypothetical protein